MPICSRVDNCEVNTIWRNTKQKSRDRFPQVLFILTYFSPIFLSLEPTRTLGCTLAQAGENWCDLLKKGQYWMKYQHLLRPSGRIFKGDQFPVPSEEKELMPYWKPDINTMLKWSHALKRHKGNYLDPAGLARAVYHGLEADAIFLI